MKLSVDIKNAQGGYPYKYKRTPMTRLKRWECEAAKLEVSEAASEAALSINSDLMDGLEAENEALRGYATHKPGCYESGDECICGLDALLTGE